MVARGDLCVVTPRSLAWLGLALVAIGIGMPGFHHVRCEGTAGDAAARGEPIDMPRPCAETFPGELLPIAIVIGVVGAVTLFAGARTLAREGERGTAARFIVGAAALALLIPTALPIAGWASVGFDLDLQADQPDGGRSCAGASGRGMPFWLQTPTCVGWLDLILTPLVLVAGILAGVAAARGSRTLLLASLALAGVGLAIHASSIALGVAEWATTSLVPLLGILLAVLAVPLLRAKSFIEGAA